MAKVKVGVAGYGTIGQRLADGVARRGHGAGWGCGPCAHAFDPCVERKRDAL